MITPFEHYEDHLYNEDILIRKSSLPGDADGMCLKYKNPNLMDVIFYDANKLDHDAKRIRCTLLHEEMHLRHPETMFSLSEPTGMIKNKERKVKRLISREYIPQKKLFDMIYIHKLQLFEIADELCLTEDLIQDAYDYYSQLESWMKRLSTLQLKEE